jgi:hypothetical protein
LFSVTKNLMMLLLTLGPLQGRRRSHTGSGAD